MLSWACCIHEVASRPSFPIYFSFRSWARDINPPIRMSCVHVVRPVASYSQDATEPENRSPDRRNRQNRFVPLVGTWFAGRQRLGQLLGQSAIRSPVPRLHTNGWSPAAARMPPSPENRSPDRRCNQNRFVRRHLVAGRQRLGQLLGDPESGPAPPRQLLVASYS